jgi:hypothetical protein
MPADSRLIFINLPVADLPRAVDFYAALGFVNNPMFTDDTAACMMVSETISVMLLTHAKWREFTNRPIPPQSASEVMLALSHDSRETVNRLAEVAAALGGVADINPAQDHGFMMSRAIADPDGHVWELTWMDPAITAPPPG